jgi:amino acid permease
LFNHQLVQVANDGQKPITFRNQAGQILQATPITVVSAASQPAASSFPINADSNTGELIAVASSSSYSIVVSMGHLSFRLVTTTSQINTAFPQQQQQPLVTQQASRR